MPVNSRRKGSAFERLIARDLRKWLGPGFQVLRLQTDRQRGQVKDQAGEFSIAGPYRLPLCIECKTGHGFDERQLWKGTGPLEGFWSQATEQADAVGLLPLLIVRRTGGPILAISQHRRLVAQGQPRMTVYTKAHESLFACLWADVLDWDPETLSYQLGGEAIYQEAP